MNPKITRLKKAFDANVYREQGHRIVDILADFLEDSTAGKTVVLPAVSPEEMLSKWPGGFRKSGSADLVERTTELLALSNNLQSPGYIGHQCSVPLPMASLVELTSALINNGSAVYEMGPSNVAMERRLIEWMAGLIGYGEAADGVFTHGGTLGNLTALLAARRTKVDYDVWKSGMRSDEPLTVLASEQSHYSVKRALGIMGMGEEALSLVPVNGDFRMDLDAAKKIHDRAVKLNRKPIAIVSNSCSTATGSYDDLVSIADFAAERDLWLHVDGAHGAAALLSEKYRHLLDGIERADSVVWDAHKMLMTPALATAVVFKDGADSYKPFSGEASYLFEKNAMDEWYNFAHRTMECTKSMMGAKLYMCLSVLGTEPFAQFVTSTYDLAREFAEVISRSSDFECPHEPQANIVCFRYLKDAVDDLSEVQRRLRRELLKSENFYIVQTDLNGETYLRVTIINPNTEMRDLLKLLDAIREKAQSPA